MTPKRVGHYEGIVSLGPKRQFTYYLVRYVPDIASGQYLNVGAIIWEAPRPGTLPGGPLFRHLVDWLPGCSHLLLTFDRHLDVDLIEAQLNFLQRRIDELRGPRPAELPGTRLAEVTSYNNSITLSKPGTIVGDDPAEVVRRLVRTYGNI